MQDNEQSPANQNNHSEHTITRFGRVCNLPNRFKDYVYQTLITLINYIKFCRHITSDFCDFIQKGKDLEPFSVVKERDVR